jgi:hypothetical protein
MEFDILYGLFFLFHKPILLNNITKDEIITRDQKI